MGLGHFFGCACHVKRYKEEKGLKICVWINSYIAQGTALFNEAVENGYLLLFI